MYAKNLSLKQSLLVFAGSEGFRAVLTEIPEAEADGKLSITVYFKET